ncbi:zinc finger, CCHC-type containing protein, partial [Tanacetum coccineum]
RQKKNDKKGKGRSEYLAPKAGIVKQKFQGTCYNYDQPGRGGEYVAPFAELCAKHGIRHEFTAPYSSQQNWIC